MTEESLETYLRARRDAGRALLVPYVTGGLTDDWLAYVRAYADAGADAVEIGLPFSDPMLDGGTIQEASDRALRRGVTPDRLLDEIASAAVEVPLVVMTYSNIVFRAGAKAFCARLAEAGVSGLVVPDVPHDEAGSLSVAATAAGIDLVLLAAPSTPPARLRSIAEESRGFIYGVTVMGTTGERASMPDSARSVAARLRELTTRPVLLGFGISTPEHAVEACRHADGVVVASALMRRVLDGATPAEVGSDVAAIRRALDTQVTASADALRQALGNEGR
ncbi:tryptophan synthase subunit alpha [Nonomuraea sp. SMC257]|uniref:Tryptophan synthase alpha chain n=1 Tax=Nonomuraea montanisoli TaxID=2741721 RepID=A0A7Y6I179_9ACTN|nr:tryptophan synthase subunit alpha [Nonomuraea montanisoli]NUW29827.1 tryptophan synthase subunit alpha [Nonomuraea montanisoli]